MMRFLSPFASLAVVAAWTPSALAADKTTEQFITEAIQGDNAEIAMGQLAQEKGASDQVKAFGKTLVDDHGKAKQDVLVLAKQMNVSAEPPPKPDAQAMHDKLSGLSGADFDKQFAAAMVDDHKKDIAAYEDQARSNQGPASALAAKQLPVLQQHLKTAQSLEGSGSNQAFAGMTAPAGDFLTQEGNDLWRGSKLVGVNIYGPDKKKVGDISDVLMNKDGKATHVVIGVGGFLGIGEKNVAIPFEKVTFTQEPVAPPAPVPANTGVAPNSTVGLGSPPDTTGSPAAPTGGAALPIASTPMAAANDAPVPQPARPTTYPDHGTVDYTADQLKAAPKFTYGTAKP